MTNIFDCILDHESDTPHVGVCESRYGTCYVELTRGGILHFPPNQRANSVQRSSARTMELFGMPTTRVEFNGVMCDVTPTDCERHPITPPGQRNYVAWGGDNIRYTTSVF